MRPPTPRLRINSEDVDLNNGPPFNTRNTSTSQLSTNNILQINPANNNSINKNTNEPSVYSKTNDSINKTINQPTTNTNIFYDLVANSDPDDMSVL